MRTTVLMPVATPVSVARTFSVMSAASVANAVPTPAAERGGRRQDVPRLVVGEREQRGRDADQEHPARRAATWSRSAGRPARRPARRRAARASSAAGRGPPAWRWRRSRSRADEGVSTKVGTSTKQLNSAKPATSVVMFVNRIGRCASICRSTSGAACGARRCPRHGNDAPTRTKSPTMRARRPAPALALGQRDHQRDAAPPASSSAPGMSTRDRVAPATRGRSGGSSTIAIRHREEAERGRGSATTGGRRSRPRARSRSRRRRRRPPTSSPIPTLTFSGGNSSRMIAKLSGKSAAAGARDGAERDQRRDAPRASPRRGSRRRRARG